MINYQTTEAEEDWYKQQNPWTKYTQEVIQVHIFIWTSLDCRLKVSMINKHYTVASVPYFRSHSTLHYTIKGMK